MKTPNPKIFEKNYSGEETNKNVTMKSSRKGVIADLNDTEVVTVNENIYYEL